MYYSVLCSLLSKCMGSYILEEIYITQPREEECNSNFDFSEEYISRSCLSFFCWHHTLTKFLFSMQVASLKDTISKKDDEIERLQLLKDLKNVYPGVNGEKRGSNSSRYVSPPTKRETL